MSSPYIVALETDSSNPIKKDEFSGNAIEMDSSNPMKKEKSFGIVALETDSSNPIKKDEFSGNAIEMDSSNPMKKEKSFGIVALETDSSNPIKKDEFSGNAIEMDSSNPMKKEKSFGNKRYKLHRQATIKHVKKPKHKYAACITGKIIIIVVIIIIAATAVVTVTNSSKGSSNKSTEPMLDTEAAKSFQFDIQSVIPPRDVSNRRRRERLLETSNMDLNMWKQSLRGIADTRKLVESARKLAIDSSKFPKDSEYTNTKTSSYVSEESAAPMNTINMIFCDILQLRADYMVDKGPYKALVDESLCSSHGSKYEWTVDVTSKGSAGWEIKIWFPQGDNIISVFVDVTKPKKEDGQPNIKLTYSLVYENIKMMAHINVEVSEDDMKSIKFGVVYDGEMDSPIPGGQVMKFDKKLIQGLSAKYDMNTKIGSATSYIGNPFSSQSVAKTYKLTFNEDFVLKYNSQSNAESCLDLRTPSLVGEQYQLYDKNGKGFVFQEGFQIEAIQTKNNVVSSAWVGYHGLHVHGKS